MTSKDILISLSKKIEQKSYHHAFLINCQNQIELDSTAMEIGRLIYCPNNSLPSDNCNICTRVLNNTAIDIAQIGDGTSTISKEEIKNLIKKISLTPLEERGIKIYIISNVENMTIEAANSLLKILEEPPKNTIAILKTLNDSKIISTIKSRCQRYNIISEVKKLESNRLTELVKSGQMVELFLYGQELNKLDKKEIREIVEDFYHNYTLRQNPALSILTLELMQDLQSKKPTSICIENFLIKISEV
ncbi:hypothetical protein [Spiroplasma endosymbiont of Panorpa germanica]|uniref:hypothetical protein n=1 Tax=Spiroplasma endosymbiont of Panorpa germanica TaxID=3066314 RepID=UPI0030CFFAB1